MSSFLKSIAVFAVFLSSFFLSVFLQAQANQDPVISSDPSDRLFEGSDYQYIISTFDVDEDLVTVTAPTLPSWLVLEENTDGFVTTFVGSGLASTQDGKGIEVSFDTPETIAIDNDNNIYVGQAGGMIRKITPEGVVTILAGGATILPDFIEGNAEESAFGRPEGIVLNSQQDLIVYADLRVFKVTREGVVTLIAGSGKSGSTDGTGTEALFRQANDIAIDNADNVYLTDGDHHIIRMVSPEGVVSTIAGSGSSGYADGTGTEAVFNTPTGITIDESGALYVADKFNFRLRKITPEGVVTTHAGSGSFGSTDGPGTSASFGQINHLTTDGQGNLYASELQTNVIRRVSLQVEASVTTMVGSGERGYVNGALTAAEFDQVDDLVFDQSGNLYVVDRGNHVIRKVYFKAYILSGNSTGQVGKHTVELAASDAEGGSAVQNFQIDVLSGETPVFSSTPPTQVSENEEYQYQLVTDEASGGEVAVTANTLPDWLSLDKVKGASVSTVVGVGSEVVNTGANLWRPMGMLQDAAGNLFFADSYNHMIRKVTPDGVMSTVAGRSNGSSKGSFADGTGTNARFDNPTYLAMDSDGNLYVSDLGNQRIRKITSEGVVTTFAGSGSAGFNDGEGTLASFQYPRGLVFDKNGNLYVADGGTNRIRVITPEGTVSTFAGSGNSGSQDGNRTDASFYSPVGLAIDSNDVMYVTDHNNRLIRKITPEGDVTTLAGSGDYTNEDGLGTKASFRSPLALAIDNSDNLFVTDGYSGRINKVTPEGLVSTVAGYRRQAPLVNGPIAAATFNNPVAILFDLDGNLLVADDNNNVIRKIEFSDPLLVGNPGFGIRDHQVELLATSPGGGTAVQTFTISVIDDTPPVFASPSDIKFVSLNEAPVAIAKATDQNSVTYSLGSDNDESLFAINEGSGLVSFLTPPDFQSPLDSDSDNNYLLEIHANDGSNEVTQNISVTVVETSGNTNPVISSTPPLRIWSNENYEYTISAYDTDGDDVAVAATTLPEWLSLKTEEGGLVSTYAGSGSQSYADGFSTNASFQYLTHMAIDGDDNLYISDWGNNRIRKISSTGEVSTLAGSGYTGTSDGTALSADIAQPNGIGVDSDGNVYVITRNRVRKVSTDGQVTTLAGSVSQGYADGTGTDAIFSNPDGLILDSDNNLYIADSGNNRIRKVSPEGVVTTLAGSGDSSFAEGTGTEASFYSPVDLAIDNANNLYVADLFNYRVRKITPEGVVSSLAGSGFSGFIDGTGTDVRFDRISGIEYAPDGNIYVMEREANVIRKISLEGVVTTVAGNGERAVVNGRGTDAGFYNPYDIVFDKSGNSYITEQNTLGLIRKISAPGYILQGNPIGQSGPQSVTLIALDSEGGSFEQSFSIKIDDASLPRFTSLPLETIDEEEDYLYLIEADHNSASSLDLSSTNLPGWLSLGTHSQGLVTDFTGGGYRDERDGTGSEALFKELNRMTVDSNGNLYVSDISSNNIRKVSLEGVVTTIAGNSTYDYQDGSGTEAAFRTPSGLAIDPTGNLYVADTWNHAIRVISPTGVVSTFAGNGTLGYKDGQGTAAQFFAPKDLVFDSSGNLYVTDYGNERIRKITPAGVVSTFAGNGTAGLMDGTGTDARFYRPDPVDIDSEGNLFVIDGLNYVLRKISPDGVVTTIAGSGSQGFADGSGTEASFNQAIGIVIDADDNIFISDTFNNRIRKVTQSGVVVTVAGSGANSYANGTGSQAAFGLPGGIVIGADNNFYIADPLNYRIRKMSLPFKALSGKPLGKLGDYDITLVATDAENNSTEQTFSISVQDVAPPVLLSSKSIDFIPGGVTQAYIAEAADRNPVSFGLGTENDEGLFGVDEKTGLISFLAMPDFQNPLDGDIDNLYQVELRIDDGHNVTSEIIEITVLNTTSNTNPVITTTPEGSIFENEEFQYFVGVRDQEFDPISVTATTLPDWMTLERRREGYVTTIAGSGQGQILDGKGTQAAIDGPTSIAIDKNDNLYVGDFTGRIRKITVDGTVTTFAGGGATVYTNKEFIAGTGTEARFNSVRSMVLDSNGNIFAATGNNHIIKVNPLGEVSHFVGSGASGAVDGIGENASVGAISDMTIDGDDIIYFVDTYNNLIRKVTPQGEVTTIAGSGASSFRDGSGTDASFFGPSGIAIDGAGNLYVADTYNYRIRKIDPAGVVSTLVGSAGRGSQDGSSDIASFWFMGRMVIDRASNLYVVDNDRFIRKITLGGTVSSFAGNEEKGYKEGKPLEASFSLTSGHMVFDRSGNMLVADSGNDRIRKIFTDVYVVNGDPAGQVGFHSVELLALDNQGGQAQQHFDLNVLGNTVPLFISDPEIQVSSEEEYQYIVKSETASGEVPIITATTLPDWLSLNKYEGATVSTVVSNRNGLTVVGNPNSSPNLSRPAGMAFDASGNLYFVDWLDDVLRMVTPDKKLYIIAGSGNKGFQDGTGTEAIFNAPTDVAIDASGNLYVSDTQNHRIRKVTPDGVVTTFVGSGNPGLVNGMGTEASFNGPKGLVFDSKGNLYVADQQSNSVRIIYPDGRVDTFAGSINWGSADNIDPLLATFQGPRGLAIDDDDNLYVADTFNNSIRKISKQDGVTTLAGSGTWGYKDGTGTEVQFAAPEDLFVDPSGNIFIADTGNNRIRLLEPDGTVSTIAGGEGASHTDGYAFLAEFKKPAALLLDDEGSLYVGDQENFVIRKVSFENPVLVGKPVGLTGPYDVELKATASGGGTASQSFTVNVIDETPPAFISVVAVVYKENSNEVVYTALATDINTVTYGLGNTMDEALFSIDANSGEVLFLVSPDFEVPTDGDSDNQYKIEIIASDGGNEESLIVTISVQDTRDGALTFTSVPATSINEGDYYSYEAITNDPETETIEIEAAKLPDWLKLNKEDEGIVSTYAGEQFDNQFISFGQITGVAVAKSGKVYIADPIQSRLWVVGLDGVASILAGSGKKGFGDGVGTSAHFVNPTDVAMDPEGNIIVADAAGHRIRKVTPAGVVTTLAGSGKKGLVDGSAFEAQFNTLESIVLDDSGNIYVTEFGNHTIRKITSEGVVSTLAGSGTSGFADGTGTEASFSAPKGLDIDNEGNLYVADHQNRVIRKITADGVVSVFAGSGVYGTQDGTGTEASFSFPYDVAIGPDANIYISEFSDHFIRRITPAGEVSTYGGSGTRGEVNGPVGGATFNHPAGIVFDQFGNLYIAEWGGKKVRRVSAGKTVLSGSPLLAGSYDVELSANDGEDGTASQMFTVQVQGTTPQLLSILRNSPAIEQIHSTTATFRIIFSENVVNVDATDFVFNAGGEAQTSFVTKISDRVYDIVSSSLPVGLIDLDLSPDHDIQDQSGTLLASLLPRDIEETFTISNQAPQILSEPVISVDEDELYFSPIDVRDADSDRPNIMDVTLPDWMTIEGEFPGQIATVAGALSSGFDDGTGTSAAFSGPHDVVMDDSGNLYIADTWNNAIRKISPEWVVTTLAGSGTFGSDDGVGTLASFSSPTAIAIDQNGNIIVADASSGNIRKVTPEGVVTTLAGSGANGYADGAGNQASFNTPSGVAVAPDGMIYIADTWNHVIRKIDQSGNVTTIAGSETRGSADGPAAEALFNVPKGLAFDSAGNLYIVDSQNHGIRKIDQNGIVSTFAGGNALGFVNGSVSEATFFQPSGIHIDAADNIFIADTENHLIRKISGSGIVSTVAGNGYRGVADIIGTALKAPLNTPMGITSDTQGNIFIVEQWSHMLRKISTGSLAFNGDPEGQVGKHDVLITFQDDFGAEVKQSFILTVNDVTAPVFTSQTTSQVNENVSGTVYDAEVSDQSSVTFSLGSAGDEAGFNIDPVEGYLSFMEAPDFEDPADADQDNDYIVEVIATDTEGNFASHMVTITVLDIEEIAPVITISSTQVPLTNAESFTVDFNLSEEVTGFTVDDLTVVNGLVTNFTGSATAYSVEISPMADGEVTIDIATGVMVDLSGNDNEAAVQFSIVSDRTAPVIIIDIAEPAVTNAASFPVIFNLSEEVEGFTTDDISLNNATVSDFTGSALQYSATLTPIADGDIAVGIPDGMMTDLAGNQNDPADPFVITSDRTLPVVTISSDASGAINDASFDITLSLSEVVQGFTADDIAVVNGILSDFSGSGIAYNATVTPIADGTVTVDIAADQMTDEAGNGNAQATQFSLVSDKTGPVVTISSNVSGAINDASFDITLTLSEVVQGFTVADITVVNGTISGFAGSGTSYSATVTPVTEGAVTVDIAADQITDLAGNGNAEATTFSVEVDQTRPTGILTGPSTLLINEAFTTTIEYSEEVSGLSIDDLVVSNAIASDFAAVTEGEKWTVLITPQMDGAVAISLPEGIASDLAGNTSEATNSLNFTFDGTTPEVTAISRQGDNTLLTTEATFEVTFSEDVTGVDQADFELSTSGTVTAIISNVTSTDARSYQVTVNQVAGEGSLGLNLKADGSIMDLAGNVLSGDFTGESYTTNFSPTAITLSSSSLAENSGADAIIGTIAATDADTEDTHTFMLVAGQGSEDNSSFAIDENQLKTLVSFDFETKPSYAIRLKADDGKGGVFEQAFTIEVTNVSEPGLSLEGSLEFGAVGKNESRDISFTINNTGDGLLEISGLSFSDGFSSDWTGGTISLGGSQMVTVTFSPTDVKVYSGDITITSTAGTSTISASGEGTLVTSIDDDIITAEEIKLYPNPATKRITIDLAAYAGKPVNLTIQDVTGRVRLVRKGVRDSKVILDLASYEEGLFILQLSNDRSKAYKKFMIKR